MTIFDYAVLAVLGISAIVGISRGLVREVFSLAGWLAAAAAAVVFAGEAAKLMPGSFATPLVRTLIAFVVLFLIVLIVVNAVGLLFAKLVRASGLGVTDRTLGAVFGVVRGALILVVLALAAGLTALPRERFWREARLSAPLETAALAAKPYLPDALSQRVHYER
jgi:membrane protein required for colicin V production